MRSRRIIRRKVEDIRITLHKGMTNNMAIPNKVILNSNTTSNRVMDNHRRKILPEKLRHPKKLRP